jgi:3',5'-nucleoside bisphosphate phosphatase
MVSRSSAPIRAELHCHTTASDGVITPAELLAQAETAGLTHLVITDHDILDGYREATSLASSIALFPGIELSASHDGRDVHILGYFIDPDDASLAAACRQTNERREERTRIMMSRLTDDGFRCLPDDFAAAGFSVINRANLARVMVAQGYAQTIDEVFDTYLSEESPYYEPRGDMDAREAIELVRDSGGVSVLAHPYHYGLVEYIPYLASQGLSGIEAFHSEHPLVVASYLERMGHEMGILVTGGSDYHGDGVHGAVLGGCQPSQADLDALFAHAAH